VRQAGKYGVAAGVGSRWMSSESGGQRNRAWEIEACVVRTAHAKACMCRGRLSNALTSGPPHSVIGGRPDEHTAL
jgi:hypothetical protein